MRSRLSRWSTEKNNRIMTGGHRPMDKVNVVRAKGEPAVSFFCCMCGYGRMVGRPFSRSTFYESRTAGAPSPVLPVSNISAARHPRQTGHPIPNLSQQSPPLSPPAVINCVVVAGSRRVTNGEEMELSSPPGIGLRERSFELLFIYINHCDEKHGDNRPDHEPHDTEHGQSPQC